MSITRLGLSKPDVARLRARGLRTLGDLAKARSLVAALRDLDARSVETLRRALDHGARPQPATSRGPSSASSGLAPEVREAIARAQRASDRWKAARLARERGPIPELTRVRETPRLRAMLAMADATLKGMRARQPWATAERARDELDAYARAVEELLGPEG